MPKSTIQINRRATNITLPVDMLLQVREQGLKAEIARTYGAQWLEENREALVSSNDYVERNGLPLSEFRQF